MKEIKSKKFYKVLLILYSLTPSDMNKKKNECPKVLKSQKKHSYLRYSLDLISNALEELEDLDGLRCFFSIFWRYFYFRYETNSL